MSGASIIDAKRLLAEAGVKEGMRVADFGAGRAGHFVFPAAQLVGESGEVFAVDVVKDVLQMIEGRTKLFSLLNLHTVWADFERAGAVKVPEHSLDMVFLINNLWCVEDFAAVLSEVRRVLKISGKLLIVDWRRKTTYPMAPPAEKRLDAMQAEAQLMKHGFTKSQDISAGEHSWGMLTKPA